MKRPKTKTKSKKKKSNKSKDEWAFDGGVVIENNNHKQDDGKNDKFKRRKTQEFDEKMRRGRRKMFQNNITQKFNQKMSKKISFTDVFDKNDKFINTTNNNNIDNKQIKSKESVSKTIAHDNDEEENQDPKSVLNRLSKLIKRDLREKKSSSNSFISSTIKAIIKKDSLNNKDSFDNSNNNNLQVNQEKKLNAIHNITINDNTSIVINAHDHEEKEDMNDADDDDNNNIIDDEDEEDEDNTTNGGKQTCFSWFFNSQEQPLSSSSLTSSSSSSSSNNSLKKINFSDILINNSNSNSNSNNKSTSSSFIHKNHQQQQQQQELQSEHQSLHIQNSYELFGHITKPEFIHTFKAYQDIPNLSKVLKSHPYGTMNFHHNDTAKVLLPYLFSYMDVFIERPQFQDDSNSMNCMIVHIVNHIIKSRIKVLKNNYKLKKRKENQLLLQASNNNSTNSKNKSKNKIQKNIKISNTNIHNNTEVADIDESSVHHHHQQQQQEEQQQHALQDQGYVRPRVLILCPFRSSARKIVQSILSILGPNTTVSNSIKFEQEYGNNYEDDNDNDDNNNDDEEEEEEDNQNMSTSLNSNPKKSKRPKFRPRPKPKDYRDVFHDNIDDDFKMGLQINPGQGKGAGNEKGAYLRLFSDFFQSDLILASPIGLKLMVENNINHDLNYDFLSSLEIIMLHQADILYMQNWEHVEFIMKQTNQLPTSNNHNIDFSRVKSYFLEKNDSLLHRQLLLSTYFTEPIIHSLFRQHGHSQAGCIKLKKLWNDYHTTNNDGGHSIGSSNSSSSSSNGGGGGFINQINLNIKQIFQKVPIHSLQSQDDDRFQYFCQNILNQLIRYDQTRTLIITPSYFHYVRVRNELIRREVDAAYICEYSRESEISRGRSRFFSGQKKILLYSGRAHFFRRFNLRGAMHVIFYSLPEYPHFYPELVNSLQEAEAGGLGSETDTVALFTVYEKMALERIVGSERCNHMLTSNKSTFVFK